MLASGVTAKLLPACLPRGGATLLMLLARVLVQVAIAAHVTLAGKATGAHASTQTNVIVVRARMAQRALIQRRINLYFWMRTGVSVLRALQTGCVLSGGTPKRLLILNATERCVLLTKEAVAM